VEGPEAGVAGAPLHLLPLPVGPWAASSQQCPTSSAFSALQQLSSRVSAWVCEWVSQCWWCLLIMQFPSLPLHPVQPLRTQASPVSLRLCQWRGPGGLTSWQTLKTVHAMHLGGTIMSW
jgi:hypothetical protein